MRKADGDEQSIKSSLLNKSHTLRDLRKGTTTTEKTPLSERILHNYASSSSHKVNSSFSSCQSAATTNKRKSLTLSSKWQVVREIRYPLEFRGLYNVKISPHEDCFIVSYGAGVIQLWKLNYGSKNTNTGEEDCVYIRSLPAQGFPIMCLQFLPNPIKFFAAGTCGSIFLCGLLAGQHQEFAKEEENEINAMDVNMGGDSLVTGGKDATLRIYDINTGKIKYKLESREDASYHKMRIFSIRCHDELTDVFLSGGWDDCVKIWDMRTPNEMVREIKGPHVCGDAIDIKDNTILTGSWTVEKSLQTWDFGTAKLITTVTPVNRPSTLNGEFLYCARYYKGDAMPSTAITGGSGIGAVEIIDIEEKKVTSSFKVHKSVQAIDSTTNNIIFGGMESVFKIVEK